MSAKAFSARHSALHSTKAQCPSSPTASTRTSVGSAHSSRSSSSRSSSSPPTLRGPSASSLRVPRPPSGRAATAFRASSQPCCPQRDGPFMPAPFGLRQSAGYSIAGYRGYRPGVDMDRATVGLQHRSAGRFVQRVGKYTSQAELEDEWRYWRGSPDTKSDRLRLRAACNGSLTVGQYRRELPGLTPKSFTRQ